MKHLPIVALSVAALLAGCSKSETAATASAPAPAAAPAPVAETAPQPSSQLLERLARQEAAAKMLLDAPKPEPAAKPLPAAKASPAPSSVPVQARASPPPAPEAAVPAKKSETASAPRAPATAVPVTPPPAADVPAKKPGTAPAATIAKAAPLPEAPSRVIQRVEPDFPREAMRDGYDSGVVKVRMDVDAEGNVTRVDILESRPRRVFDRAVSSALSQWKFNAGRPGRAVETEIAFRR